jgi:hypothetical protein
MVALSLSLVAVVKMGVVVPTVVRISFGIAVVAVVLDFFVLDVSGLVENSVLSVFGFDVVSVVESGLAKFETG